MALTVWDQSLGSTREATQQDIDLLQAQANALGRINAEITDVLQALRAVVISIQQKYQRSAELSGDL